MVPSAVTTELVLFFGGGVALYVLAILLARRAHPIIAERGGPGWCTTFEVTSWLAFLCAVICWPLGLFITLYVSRSDDRLVNIALWLGRIPVISVITFLLVGILLLILSEKHRPTVLYDEFEDRDIRFRQTGARQTMALVACLGIAGLMGDVMNQRWKSAEPEEVIHFSEKTPEERRADRINQEMRRNPNVDINKLGAELDRLERGR